MNQEAEVSSEPDSLKSLAREVTQHRIEGTPVSGPEPEPRKSEAPPPVVARAYDNLESTPSREPPIIQQTDRGVPIRDAAEAVAKWRHERSDGDIELQKQLAEFDPEAIENLDDNERQRILDAVAEQERINNAANETVETVRERLALVEQENAQRRAENERLKAEKQAQALQAQVKQESNEVQHYQAALQQNFFETYPEAER